jgi:hypothetical protein
MIILLVSIVFLLYYILSSFFATKTTINKQTYLGNGVPSAPLGDMSGIGNKQYSLDLWVYANAVKGASGPSTFGSSNSKGNLFFIGDLNNNYISVDLFNDGSAEVNFSPNNLKVLITKNFPLQRWEHIIINVNNSLIEIYLDGKLIRSLKSPTPPASPTVNSSIFFGTGDIYIAQLNRNLFLYDTTLAYDTYIKGNNGYIVTPYSATVSLLKNNEPTYNYQVW